MDRRLRSTLVVAGAGALVALASAPRGALADEPGGCNAWDVEYALSANLQLTDTPMGKGDGVYRIGPGRVVLRYEDRGGAPGGVARMREYAMTERFEIHSSALFWSADVTTSTKTAATPDACGSAAEGTFDGSTLRWVTPVRGYHTDGTITCQGSLCGKFHAPPPGVSEFHVAPHPVPFSAFAFSADKQTFSMPRTLVSKTEEPQQTAYIQLGGRETSRKCVRAGPCK